MAYNLRKFDSLPLINKRDSIDKGHGRTKSVDGFDQIEGSKPSSPQGVKSRIFELQRGTELRKIKRLEKSPERKELGVLMYHMKKKDER
jgi:hypothetical protein